MPSITHEEANEQFFEEAARWELPPGWDWPEGPIYSGIGPDGARAGYGLNIGRGDATFYWYCAWSRTLLEASSDSDRAAALQQVLRVRETNYYTSFLPEDRSAVDARLSAAEAGDFRELEQTVDLNCPEASHR